ncbi:hypothetical protein CP533_3667 [Ophiocordyceps camponoti-saundersi (nom. inval.)]|nr:hypothetical protein CP533_3667 [Ophiocordyceps camponoti-saundersi (nom. inval.)]
MSSNPFRKKTVEALDTAKTRAPSPAKSSLRSGSPLADGRRPKVVKKVRVLSPPPLSPDSPDWPTGVDDNALHNNSFAADSHAFKQSPSMTWPSDDAVYQPPPPQPPPSMGQGASPAQATPPPNPFSKTLQDLESNKELQSQRQSEGLALRVGNASRQSLNVDSFKRLLLTGTANDAGSPVSADGGATSGEGGSRGKGDGDGDDTADDDDKSSSSAVSASDGGDQLASSTNVPQSASRDKRAPPPPPSSRHGKSLRDTHKAGSIPEAEPEQDLAAETDSRRASLTSPSGRRKSAPAPPPPRGHNRTESRTAQLSVSSSTEPSPLKLPADEMPTPTSPAETPTRTDGSRNNSRAPNPPPPRRPRLSTPTSPPGAPSSQPPLTPPRHLEADHAPTAAQDDAQAESSKPAGPPPPPPTRNHSIRRRPSVGSVDSVNRREHRTREGAAPPPPPPRQRGNSVGSLDASPRHASVTDGSAQGAATVNEAADDDGGNDAGKGSDILADLDALQREVDALRGQLG